MGVQVPRRPDQRKPEDNVQYAHILEFPENTENTMICELIVWLLGFMLEKCAERYSEYL